MRPGYEPLARPHEDGPLRRHSDPPPGVPALVICPPLARIAQRLAISLHEVDELTISQVLDEIDLLAYLHDEDNPPPPPKRPKLAGPLKFPASL